MRPDAAKTLEKGLVGHRPVEPQLQQRLRPSRLIGNQLTYGPIVCIASFPSLGCSQSEQTQSIGPDEISIDVRCNVIHVP